MSDDIDIGKESQLMIFFWGFFSFSNLVLQTVANNSKNLSYDMEKAVAIAAFSLIYVRNLSIALIAFYYSVFQ